MPAQIPTERPSLTMTLEERYATQRAGGAYDAKSVKTGIGERMPVLAADGVSDAITENQWTNDDFKVKESQMNGDLKEKSLHFLDTTGHSTVKYKP